MSVPVNSSASRLKLAKALWGWRPHETQRLWLLDESRTKVAACGRRWGKTEAAAIDAATLAITEPGSVQMIVAPTYDQSRLIVEAVERLLLDHIATRRLTKVTRTPYPRIAVGRSLIMARTADEDGRNLRGNSADRVIVDEAAYVRDSVVLEVISPMLADRDGRLVLISTPFGKNHFYRRFVQGQRSEVEARGRCASYTFPSVSNPHINAEYVDQQRQELTPRQFAVEYEARFIDNQQAVFAWEDIQAAVERGARNTPGVSGFGRSESRETGGYAPGVSGFERSGNPETDDPFECVVAGIDWARYTDYTAVIALGVGESGCSVVGIERMNAMKWEMLVDRVAGFLRAHRVLSALTDQTSMGDPVQEQLANRIWETGGETRVEGFVFSNSSKRELVENLAMSFARGAISIPRDENLLRELQYFEYELTESGNVRMNARPGYHDDLVMALALACRQARSMGVAGAYLSRRGRVSAEGWQ